VLNLQFATQGIAGEVVELMAQNWGDVGIQTTVKEVTPDEYRSAQSSNQLDVLMWLKGQPAAIHMGDNTYWGAALRRVFRHPHRHALGRVHRLERRRGVEPPAWVGEMIDRGRLPVLRARLGRAERAGAKLAEMMVDQMLFIGTVSGAGADLQPQRAGERDRVQDLVLRILPHLSLPGGAVVAFRRELMPLG
jgi:peptide/nickel transport system substrate-binding protein